MNRELLERGLLQLGIEFGEDTIQQFDTYLKELELWNRAINLVKAEGDELVARHILDCAAGIPPISGQAPKTLLDVGTGAGLPGIVLSILMPDVEVTLLDKLEKRIGFLRNCVALLGLEKCTILQSDLADATGQFDVVCCRAFRPLTAVFEGLVHRITPEGSLVLYKGKITAIEEELRGLGSRAEGYQHQIINLDVPNLREERHLLVFRDTSR